MTSTRFVLTVDTEEDSPRWRPERDITVKNIEALPRLQSLLDRYGVKPTYLVTYPVCTNERSAGILKNLLGQGNCEIGAHVHPWNTPPYESSDEMLKLGYPCNSKLEYEKIRNLTGRIGEVFGVRPVSYRAGRFGLGANTIKYLERLNYRVDTSVSPFMSWRGDGGPSFIDSPLDAYMCGERILEIPVSIIVNRSLSSGLMRWYCSLPFSVKYLLRKTHLIKTIWLRPTIYTLDEMTTLINRLLGKKVKTINMMFHSNELMAGQSRYIKSDAQVDAVFQRIESILEFLARKDIWSYTLREVAESWG